MLTFKQFIAEGGNVTIGGHAAEKFAINAENRPHVQKDVKDTAKAVANSFHKEHPGHHLFGKGHKALETGSGYAGSTHHLMDPNISHEEFHKGMTAKGDTHARPGDMDLKVPHEHLEKLKAHLDKHIGKKFGPYKLLSTKNGSGQKHAIMQHTKTGAKHQIDFEGSDYEHDEPSHGDRFTHSSNWEDRKAGIKGAHHKILVNAAGREKHVFSPQYGLGRRDDKEKPSKQNRTKNSHEVTKALFGPKADEKKIHSFHGVTDLIKKHVPKEHHQEIYDKFKSRVQKNDIAHQFSHEAALGHLKKHLNVTDHEENT